MQRRSREGRCEEVSKERGGKKGTGGSRRRGGKKGRGRSRRRGGGEGVTV